jgi:hypothetical protein
VGGEVQLGPLGTAATNWPIVPAPGDYEDGEFGGMMIGRENRSTRRKSTSVPLCPQQIPHYLTGREPGPPKWEASDYGAALLLLLLLLLLIFGRYPSFVQCFLLLGTVA